MEIPEIVDEILNYIPTIDFSQSYRGQQISLFETNIRYIGGMLAGYDLLKGPLSHLASNVSSLSAQSLFPNRTSATIGLTLQSTVYSSRCHSFSGSISRKHTILRFRHPLRHPAKRSLRRKPDLGQFHHQRSRHSRLISPRMDTSFRPDGQRHLCSIDGESRVVSPESAAGD